MSKQHEQQPDLSACLADRIARFAGSMPFFYLNATWFVLHIGLNLFTTWRFDPFPFGLLTLAVSLEAIFLTIFVLIAQNRQATADRRIAQTDMQTNQHAEHEIRLLMEHLGKQDTQLTRIEQLLTERKVK